ncbi:hypothetical protein C8R43DRAFT_957344 [Mycena crocata]|nr:hypothetical protein C8R43DRAFT_957344 [Mycena crocata]
MGPPRLIYFLPSFVELLPICNWAALFSLSPVAYIFVCSVGSQINTLTSSLFSKADHVYLKAQCRSVAKAFLVLVIDVAIFALSRISLYRDGAKAAVDARALYFVQELLQSPNHGVRGVPAGC